MNTTTSEADLAEHASIRVTKEIAAALKKIAVMSEQSICKWLEDMLIEKYDNKELARFSPSLAARKKVLARKVANTKPARTIKTGKASAKETAEASRKGLTIKQLRAGGAA